MPTPDINAILRRNPVNGARGAPLGAASYADSHERCYLQRVRMIDGGYAADGTYWGGGRGTEPLWCAFTEDGETRLYVRARRRYDAVRELILRYPGLKFHRAAP